MTEIEPTIDNVREGDAVTIEEGAPDEPGYSAFTVRVTGEAEPVAYTRSLGWLRGRVRREGWKITRIIRPAPPISSGRRRSGWTGAVCWAHVQLGPSSVTSSGPSGSGRGSRE